MAENNDIDPPKKKRGRQRENPNSLVPPTVAMKRVRDSIQSSIDNAETEHSIWPERVCVEVLYKRKHHDLHEKAWRRFGEIKGYLKNEH